PPARETSATEGRASMPIVKVIELVGESPHSWEDAAQVAVREAAKTIRNITGVEVLNWTGNVDERGNIVEYNADVQVAFVVEGHEWSRSPLRRTPGKGVKTLDFLGTIVRFVVSALVLMFVGFLLPGFAPLGFLNALLAAIVIA